MRKLVSKSASFYGCLISWTTVAILVVLLCQACEASSHRRRKLCSSDIPEIMRRVCGPDGYNSVGIKKKNNLPTRSIWQYLKDITLPRSTVVTPKILYRKKRGIAHECCDHEHGCTFDEAQMYCRRAIEPERLHDARRIFYYGMPTTEEVQSEIVWPSRESSTTTTTTTTPMPRPLPHERWIQGATDPPHIIYIPQRGNEYGGERNHILSDMTITNEYLPQSGSDYPYDD